MEGVANDRRCALSLLAASALFLSGAGCGGKSPPAEAAGKSGSNSPVVSVPGTTPAGGEAALPDDALHVPFTKATHGPDDPPALCNRPPDRTITGKPVGKLFDEVVNLWETIRFVSPSGKSLQYSATVETDQGTIEISLRPDVAPNHVRNFIALAKAGYYDGLRVDRIRHEEAEGQAGPALDEIEVGCPLGTGEAGYGSIGYWLKPEFDDKDKPKLPHEEGTVGACRGMEADSAACRFYVTLSKAPYLDGNYTAFGKVTSGLDVVRRIHQVPAVASESDPDGSRRPLNPVVIRKVTIQVHE
jgi:peptidyl-prolyl cis-trans isomerase B (cyclophilin B)